VAVFDVGVSTVSHEQAAVVVVSKKRCEVQRRCLIVHIADLVGKLALK